MPIRPLLWVLAVAAAVLTACAALPPAEPRAHSPALAMGTHTALDRVAIATRASSTRGGDSGFRLLHVGPTSLHARLELIRRAQRSLDLQYYHVHGDETGFTILRALRDAAARGVRVRLLLDDMYTSGMDEVLLALEAHPHVEVRLFNPFAVRGSTSWRLAASLLDLGRVNRRMHNKLLVADGAVALTGGRNIGDPYHGHDAQANFLDFEMLVVGAVVPALAEAFDTYWNSRQVHGVRSVVPDHLPLAERAATFDGLTRTAAEGRALAVPARDFLGQAPVAGELDRGALELRWGSARYVADPPEKVEGRSGLADPHGDAPMGVARAAVSAEIAKARDEILLTTPYLVPGREAMARIEATARRGVRQSLLTNSFASTDEPVVHTGYRRYRPALIAAGVELFELSPPHTRRLYGDEAAARRSWFRLHAKSVIIDQRVLYVGSLNFDPRSDLLNTEAGLIIECPGLAQDAHHLVRLIQRDMAHQVRFAPDGRGLEWFRVDDQATPQVLTQEPGLDAWRRLKLQIQSLLVPEWLL